MYVQVDLSKYSRNCIRCVSRSWRKCTKVAKFEGKIPCYCVAIFFVTCYLPSVFLPLPFLLMRKRTNAQFHLRWKTRKHIRPTQQATWHGMHKTLIRKLTDATKGNRRRPKTLFTFSVLNPIWHEESKLKVDCKQSGIRPHQKLDMEYFSESNLFSG